MDRIRGPRVGTRNHVAVVDAAHGWAVRHPHRPLDRGSRSGGRRAGTAGRSSEGRVITKAVVSIEGTPFRAATHAGEQPAAGTGGSAGGDRGAGEGPRRRGIRPAHKARHSPKSGRARSRPKVCGSFAQLDRWLLLFEVEAFAPRVVRRSPGGEVQRHFALLQLGIAAGSSLLVVSFVERDGRDPRSSFRATVPLEARERFTSWPRVLARGRQKKTRERGPLGPLRIE